MWPVPQRKHNTSMQVFVNKGTDSPNYNHLGDQAIIRDIGNIPVARNHFKVDRGGAFPVHTHTHTHARARARARMPQVVSPKWFNTYMHLETFCNIKTWEEGDFLVHVTGESTIWCLFACCLLSNWKKCKRRKLKQQGTI